MTENSDALGIQIECDRLQVRGKDRANWLHNFCTADIKRLSPMETVEAFVLNTKGKVIGWLQVFCYDNYLELLMPAGMSKDLVNHFSRYVIREDVKFVDESGRAFSFFLWGDHVDQSFLEQTGCSIPDGKVVNCVLNGQVLEASRINLIGPGILLTVDVQSLSDPEAWFSSTHFVEGTPNQLMGHRIRHGCPKWNTDFNDDYLPQELCRDELAISFTKGCYLGQETVARIDALGHVNRVLAVVALENAAFESLPQDVFCGEEKIGRLTSLADDPGVDRRSWGLATIKRGFSKGNLALRIGGISAHVVERRTSNV